MSSSLSVFTKWSVGRFGLQMSCGALSREERGVIAALLKTAIHMHPNQFVRAGQNAYMQQAYLDCWAR